MRYYAFSRAQLMAEPQDLCKTCGHELISHTCGGCIQSRGTLAVECHVGVCRCERYIPLKMSREVFFAMNS